MILTTPTIQIARESAVSTKDLNHKIQEFQAVLSDPKSNPLPLAQELYQLLIGPIAEDLKQAKSQTLMVSLDGAMRYIPLAALHDGKHYLIEDYRIAIYTEAAKDKLKDNPKNQWTVAGLGLTRKVQGFFALPSVEQEIEGIVKAGESRRATRRSALGFRLYRQTATRRTGQVLPRTAYRQPLCFQTG